MGKIVDDIVCDKSEKNGKRKREQTVNEHTVLFCYIRLFRSKISVRLKMAEFKAVFIKLNSDNYFMWKYKMEMYLRKEKSWTAISGQRPVVPEPTANDESRAEITAQQTALATFVERDEQALAMIGLCVEDSQLVHIRNKITAKEAWDTLRTYHERNTLGNKVTLMRKVCGLKLAEGGQY